MFLEQGAGPPGSGLREAVPFLGGTLGHFIFSLIGLKRILFTDIFQKLSKPPSFARAIFLLRSDLGIGGFWFRIVEVQQAAYPFRVMQKHT